MVKEASRQPTPYVSVNSNWVHLPGQPPGKIFLSERIKATTAIFCLIHCAGAKNDTRISGGGAKFSQTRRNCSLSLQKILKTLRKLRDSKVCTISFERPVNYLSDAWHVFPPKCQGWTHFNRPWTEYQCQGVVWTLLMTFTESVNRSTRVSVYLIITRLRNVNLLCFSDSIEGIDFLNCTLKCPVTLKLANQNRYFY